MAHIKAIILAGGYQKKMNSRKPDVLHEICGKPMLYWVRDLLKEAGIDDMSALTDGKADSCIKKHMSCIGCENRVTKNRSNRNDDIRSALREINTDTGGHILVIPGNMPFIGSVTLKELIKQHLAENNDYTVCISESSDTGCGCHMPQRFADCAGMLPICFSYRFFSRLIEETCFWDDFYGFISAADRPDKLQVKKGSFLSADPIELITVEDRMQLAFANSVARQKILDRHMLAGVTIIDTMSTYIDDDVKIGMDTVVYPGTILEKTVVIGEACTIGPNSRIRDCRIGDEVEVTNSVMLESTIGTGAHIGPFAYIRPGSEIGENVKIGDFVEVKKSVIGDGTKVSHLTYVGDAEIGRNVNLGCGVVFVNYNGRDKNKTIVKDNAFVGCNVNLVSPVTVEENAYIAAGSTITGDVPENALAIARCRQVIKEGWVTRRDLNKKKD